MSAGTPDDGLKDSSGRADGFRRERAQVWARHATTGRWLYLPPGQADAKGPDGRTWKAMARAGMLLCPHPGCGPFATTRNDAQRRHHFVHGPGGNPHRDATGEETTWHLEAKATMATFAAVQPEFRDWAVHVDDLPIVVPEGWRRPDLLLEAPDGRRIAIEVQYSALTGTDWQVRHSFYARQSILDVWLWSPLGPNGAAPRPGRRTTRDLAGGEILWQHSARLNGAQRAQLAAGIVPLWLDPTTRTVATATTRRHPGAPTPLFVFSEPGRWTLPPNPDFSACWLAVDPLDDCTVDWTRRELSTPTRRWQQRQQEHYAAHLAADAEQRADEMRAAARAREQRQARSLPAAGARESARGLPQPVPAPAALRAGRPRRPPIEAEPPTAARDDTLLPPPPALFPDFTAPRPRGLLRRLLGMR